MARHYNQSDRKGWKVWRQVIRYNFGRKNGTPFMVERDIVYAKKRWAKRALKMCGIDPEGWTQAWIPGANICVFIAPLQIPGVLELTPEFIDKSIEEALEWNALLDVPIEEADGTTTIEDRRKGVADA